MLFQKEAVEERLPERVLRVEQAMCSFTELSPGSRKAGTKEIVGELKRLTLFPEIKNTRRVSLDVASTVLIKDPETEGFEPPSRSRCRRLYDIANVLVALGLIKKVHYLFGTKKIPLFVYCGPEPDENSKFDVNACIERLLASSASTPLTPQMKVWKDFHNFNVQQSKPAVKHAVTNILGVSNKVNIDPLNHRNSSPFQVVKKDNNIS
ncbi:transcription factor E2F/dimerization partner [Ancylostoma ceylanicum]|uniref:Transcription factor E2F/dimerization partner n=1 Tax=Ancylostoma ceylanicum TaxID=53326 RepID=A0A0D6M7V9_9BILA|nr:transcription factor E2F/dimerization partner [Ancylostoma ceylanicum]